MRFRRLAIPAYGPFTDLALEFPKGECGADFHLIYGGNEAGKSSLLRAIRDLLYGIHAQTADNFLHDYRDLRISAEIENGAGQRLMFQRRKGNRNTLLDAAGQALPDDALAPFLGPVDRDFFTTMFGLGSEELRQGAHDLLQGKGDLGQALFSASLAGTPVHRVLETLEAEARALFNGRARVGVSLRPAIDACEEAMRASRLAQVKPEAWEETLRELETVQGAKAELDAELHTLRGRQDWLRRCLDAQPTLGRLREVEASLQSLPPLPELPPGYEAAAASGRDRLAAAEQALRELQQRRDELGGRRDALTPRLDVLAAAAGIDALVAGLAVHRQRREALIADKAESAQLRARLDSGLLELGLSPEAGVIDALRMPLAAQLALREAAAALSRAELESEALRREFERLETARRKTEQRLAQLCLEDVAALREVQAATAPAVVAAQALAGKAASLDALARRLASQRQLLPGAPADPEAVYVLALPAAARLREFEAAAAELANRGRQLEEALREAEKRQRDLTGKLARLEKRGALPSPAQLAAARDWRDAGWARVLASWQAGEMATEWDGAALDTTYPAAVRQADALADRLREEAEAVAQAEELRGQLLEAEAAGEVARQEVQRLEQARRAWQDDWTELWRASGLTPASPAEMLEWREQWLEFRNRHEAWRDLRDELDTTRRLIGDAEARLRPLLAGAEQPLLALRELAESRLRAADQVLGERRGLELQLAEQRAEGETLARQQVPLDEALARARTRWRETRLGGDNRPESALRLLEAHIELVTRHDNWTRLSAAIAETESALAGYQDQARALLAAVAPGDDATTSDIDAEVAVNRLRELLVEARDLRARRAQVEEDLEQVTARLPFAEREVEAARAAMAALLREADAADQTALSALLDSHALRRRLREARDGLRASLHAQARGEVLDDFIARARGEEVATLAADLEDLARHLGEREALRVAAIQTLARAEDARARLETSGAVAAEHLQTARHAAARIRQDAARVLRLRLAIQFLRGQIEAFRERNQGPLLLKAGALFRQMTTASFSGLGCEYDENDTPTLVGLKDGASVPVTGMSEGTRDQLYLALRLAAIETHQASHEPMPLILDDLLITFDDDRGRAILPLLSELAGRSQVLLFSHHRHVIDLAREALPTDAVRVHQLAGGAV